MTNYWQLASERSPFVEALDDGLRERSAELGPTVRKVLLYAERLTADLNDEYYALATQARNQIIDEINATFEDVDLLTSTGVPIFPPRWDEAFTDIFTAMSNTVPVSLTGNPAISLLSGDREGVPTSVQFAGPYFEEELLFSVASMWETEYNRR